MKRLLLPLLLLSGSLRAQWNASALGGFAVATLSDPGIVSRLDNRFKSQGSPVFLIGNPQLGLQQGDLIRFRDKAVLIDADVWQTLRAEGALAALKVAPVVRVKATASPAAWAGRAKAVAPGKERRAYELGEQLLRALQKTFVGGADGQRLMLAFEGGQLVLSAPPAFLEQMRPGRGESPTAPIREIPEGIPHLVSHAPSALRAGTPFAWEAWAVDLSGGPTRDLRWELTGALPPGLAWTPDSHRLHGTPTTVGKWPVTVRVANAAGSDSLRLVLAVRAGSGPSFAALPPACQARRAWGFRPSLTDSSYPSWRLRLLPRSLPAGMGFDSLRQELSWQPPDSLAGKEVALDLCAANPDGDSACVRWSLAVMPPEARDTAPAPPELPPVFLTALENDSLPAGQGAFYTPVALDRHGKPAKLEVLLPPKSPLIWDGRRLRLEPGHAGDLEAEVVATDTLGRTARQKVCWHVAPSGKGLFLEMRQENGLGLWTVGADLGAARLGLWTPSIGRLTGWSDRLDMQMPYLFLGAWLVRSRESRLSMDVGVTVRAPQELFYTGGAMARLEGSFTHRWPFLWKNDLDVTGWIDQAVLVADTSGSHLMNLTWKNSVTSTYWNYNQVQVYRTSWWKAVRKTRNDQVRRDNAVVSCHLDFMGSPGHELWTGPALGLEARPLLNEASPWLGWSAQARWKLGPMLLVPTGRFGWGPDLGTGVWGGISLRLPG